MPARSYPARVTAGLTLLPAARWRAERAAHERRADEFARGRVDRRRQQLVHPVEDFLWTYYPLRPGRLRRWHAGLGRARLGVARPDPGEVTVDTAQGPAATVDLAGWRAGREATLRAVRALLTAVAGRSARHDCFGLHEWAMVYRPDAAEQPRHGLPLRLGLAGSAAVVDRLAVRCSHYDAYRFFTRAARPHNAIPLSRADQLGQDQPGCLHVTMDLLKWCLKLGPLVSGGLLLDCFELARDARTLDMRASPYDLSSLGYRPVAVETVEGRAEYAAAQRGLTARARPLRERLLAVCEAAVSEPGPDAVAGSPTRRSGAR